MEKRIKLTESELNRIVENSIRRAINEGRIDEGKVTKTAYELAKILGISLTMAAVLAADFIKGGPISTSLERQYGENVELRGGSKEAKKAVKDEFGSEQGDTSKIAKTPATTSESRINRAVMESIRRYKRNRA